LNSLESYVRIENDALGNMEVAHDVLWGIHTQRALHNFAISDRRVPYPLIAAIAAIKHAAAIANGELGFLPKNIVDVISAACDKICANEKELAASFPLDALQGGAGTSTNMNVNEVVANIALKTLGHEPGSYDVIHPLGLRPN
jgi:aspartate ammonia-lyase